MQKVLQVAYRSRLERGLLVTLISSFKPWIAYPKQYSYRRHAAALWLVVFAIGGPPPAVATTAVDPSGSASEINHEIEDLKEAIKCKPQQTRLYSRLADLYAQRKDYRKAMILLESRLNANSSTGNDVELLYNSLIPLYFHSPSDIRDFNQALLFIDRSLKLKSDGVLKVQHSEAALRSVRRQVLFQGAFASLTKEVFLLKRPALNEAVEELKKLNNIPGALSSALLLKRMGRSKAALEVLNDAISRDPDSKLLLLRSEINMQDFLEFDKAENDLTTVISRGGSAYLYTMRAMTNVLNDKADKAIVDLTNAISLKDNPYNELSLRGTLLMEKGMTTEALSDFDRSLELADTSYARGRRGQLHFRLGHMRQALVDLNLAISQNSLPSPYFRVRAKVLERLGNYERCVDDLNLLLKRFPKDPELREMKRRVAAELARVNSRITETRHQ